MKSLRICFIGDSFVNGTGDPACLGWAGRLCAMAQQQGHEITYYNLGIRGQTSRQIAQRWQTEVSARLPSDADGRIVFSFGANDSSLEDGELRVPLSESLQHAHHMLTSAQRLFPTIMVGPPPLLAEDVNQRIGTLSQQLAATCATLNVPYLAVFASLLHAQVWQAEVAANDGAHPRSAGYALIANLIHKWSAWQDWLT